MRTRPIVVAGVAVLLLATATILPLAGTAESKVNLLGAQSPFPDSGGFVATLVVTEGQAVTVRPAVGMSFPAAHGQLTLLAGDVTAVEAGTSIWVGQNSAAELTFLDGSSAELHAGTMMTVVELQTPDDGPFQVRLDQVAGRTFHRVQRLLGVGDAYVVSTPSSTASVRGTAFGVEVVGPGTTYVHTDEGVVGVSQDGQDVDVGAGDAVLTTDEEPPEVHPHGEVLADELGVPYEEVMGHFDDGFGFGQIKQVYPLSAGLGISPDQVLEELDGGMGMGVLKQATDLRTQYGLSFDEFKQKLDAGTSLGQIKQESKDEADKVTGQDKEEADKVTGQDKDKPDLVSGQDKDKGDKVTDQDKEKKEKEDKKDKKDKKEKKDKK